MRSVPTDIPQMLQRQQFLPRSWQHNHDIILFIATLSLKNRTAFGGPILLSGFLSEKSNAQMFNL